MNHEQLMAKMILAIDTQDETLAEYIAEQLLDIERHPDAE